MSKKWVKMGSTWSPTASDAETLANGGVEIVEEDYSNQTLVAYENAYQNNQHSLNESVVRAQYNSHKRIADELEHVYNNFQDVKNKFHKTDKERAEFQDKTQSQFAELEMQLSKKFKQYDSEIRSLKNTIKVQNQQLDSATAGLENKVSNIVKELQHRGEDIFAPTTRTVPKIDFNNN